MYIWKLSRKTGKFSFLTDIIKKKQMEERGKKELKMPFTLVARPLGLHYN